MAVARYSIVALAAIALNPVVATAGDGAVALQTADSSCADDGGNRYVSCGNGTITDNHTGLVWLADASCIEEVGWQAGMEFVAGLSDLDPAFCTNKGLSDSECDCSLADGSSPGEWRLPSADELRTMVMDAVAMGCSNPALTDDSGEKCAALCLHVFPPQCTFSFEGVQSDFYWSSSSLVTSPGIAHDMNLDNGFEAHASKTSPTYIWPVRGGQ